MPTFANRRCRLCAKKVAYVDYKNLPLIKRYLSQFARIVPRYYSGNCLQHQKDVMGAIKHARLMGLLPFVK